MNPSDTAPPITSASADNTASVYSKVIWRVMPFLLIALMINAIDRLNVSFAKLRMSEDILLSDAAYGIGAGMFYLGYILFEVPSNHYMQRIGARKTLTRIMVLWGLVTMGTAFVTTPEQLITARFLLGAAEAGFFPGVILYLTYWFPAALRGRITAGFLMSAILAGVICGPLAGAILGNMHGWLGLRDWQVLFVLTGLPAVILGIFGWFWLVDRPAQARWLSDSEKQSIEAALAAETSTRHAESRFIDALRDPKVYIAGFVCFCIQSGTNTVAYWMPTLIRGFGMQDMKTIGLISAAPYLIALAAMYLLGRSSDRCMERRWHLGLTMLFSAICFSLLGFVQGQMLLSIFLMSFGAAAALAAVSLFWVIPSSLLSPTGAACGIALISSFGNISGVVSQSAVGAIKSATGSLYVVFDIIAVVLTVGAIVLLVGISARQLKPGANLDR